MGISLTKCTDFRVTQYRSILKISAKIYTKYLWLTFPKLHIVHLNTPSMVKFFGAPNCVLVRTDLQH
jgi:hypothetical protein